MTGLVSSYIERFTYVGLFLVLVLCGWGLPVLEELPLLTGGSLAYRGITQFPTTLAISFIGVMAGDSLLFFLGRRLSGNSRARTASVCSSSFSAVGNRSTRGKHCVTVAGTLTVLIGLASFTTPFRWSTPSLILTMRLGPI